ncbi:MAG: ABC transporter substrate-binding protein [Candidatus Omnitrophica bacterium]|nr:ABC transporter substrate-binding protein [Candidatus Omnitrophota bacterium]
MKFLFRSLLLALLLSSCARGPANTGAITLRFMDAPDIGGAWAQLIDRFEAAHADIHIELIEGPASTNAREEIYTEAFLSGEPIFDLVYMDIIWLAQFAHSGWLRSLIPYIEEDALEEFLPGDVAGCKYQDELYAVPMRSDTSVLYYRKDLLEEAGFPPPAGLHELVTVAKSLQVLPFQWGYVFQGAQDEGLVCNFFELLWGMGGDLNLDGGEIVLNTPEAVEALRWQQNLIHLHKISPPGVTKYHEEETRHMFHEGRAVFMHNWPYAWILAQKPDSPVRGKVGILPLLQRADKESPPVLGGWRFGISALSEHPEEAWEFIRFATSAESQKLFHFANGAIPTRRALFEDPEILLESPHYSALYPALLKAHARPMHPKYAQVSGVLQRHLHRALVSGEDPQKVLKAAEAELLSTLD